MANYKKPEAPTRMLEDRVNTEYNVKNKEDKTVADKIGNFISVNTINVKGLRINLDKVFSYAPNGDTSIQIAQGDGNNTTLTFSSIEDMVKIMDKIDSRCL